MYANQFRANLIWPCSYSPRKPLLRWRTWLQRPRCSSSLGVRGGPGEAAMALWDNLHLHEPQHRLRPHLSSCRNEDLPPRCRQPTTEQAFVYILLYFSPAICFDCLPISEAWRFWSIKIVYDGCPVLLIFSAIRFTIRLRASAAVHYRIENNTYQLNSTSVLCGEETVNWQFRNSSHTTWTATVCNLLIYIVSVSDAKVGEIKARGIFARNLRQYKAGAYKST